MSSECGAGRGSDTTGGGCPDSRPDTYEDLVERLAQAEQQLAICAADTTAADLAQEVEFLKAEKAHLLAALEEANAR